MKASFILGLIGGIIGVVAGLFVIMVDTLFQIDGMSVQGWLAIIASTMAIITAVYASKYPKWSGSMLIFSGLVGVISISLFYVLPFILLEIAGILQLANRSSVSKK